MSTVGSRVLADAARSVPTGLVLSTAYDSHVAVPGVGAHGSTPMMPRSSQAQFGQVPLDEVLVVGHSAAGWRCEVEGRHLVIDAGQIAPGHRMPSAGQRGRVMLTLAAARAFDVGRRRM